MGPILEPFWEPFWTHFGTIFGTILSFILVYLWHIFGIALIFFRKHFGRRCGSDSIDISVWISVQFLLMFMLASGLGFGSPLTPSEASAASRVRQLGVDGHMYKQPRTNKARHSHINTNTPCHRQPRLSMSSLIAWLALLFLLAGSFPF